MGPILSDRAGGGNGLTKLWCIAYIYGSQFQLSLTGSAMPSPLPQSSTGFARFAVQAGTGRYAGARGSGVASLAEDAANHHRITLIGRVAAHR